MGNLSKVLGYIGSRAVKYPGAAASTAIIPGLYGVGYMDDTRVVSEDEDWRHKALRHLTRVSKGSSKVTGAAREWAKAATPQSVKNTVEDAATNIYTNLRPGGSEYMLPYGDIDTMQAPVDIPVQKEDMTMESVGALLTPVMISILAATPKGRRLLARGPMLTQPGRLAKLRARVVPLTTKAELGGHLYKKTPAGWQSGTKVLTDSEMAAHAAAGRAQAPAGFINTGYRMVGNAAVTGGAGIAMEHGLTRKLQETPVESEQALDIAKQKAAALTADKKERDDSEAHARDIAGAQDLAYKRAQKLKLLMASAAGGVVGGTAGYMISKEDKLLWSLAGSVAGSAVPYLLNAIRNRIEKTSSDAGKTDWSGLWDRYKYDIGSGTAAGLGAGGLIGSAIYPKQRWWMLPGSAGMFGAAYWLARQGALQREPAPTAANLRRNPALAYRQTHPQHGDVMAIVNKYSNMNSTPQGERLNPDTVNRTLWRNDEINAQAGRNNWNKEQVMKAKMDMIDTEFKLKQQMEAVGEEGVRGFRDFYNSALAAADSPDLLSAVDKGTEGISKFVEWAYSPVPPTAPITKEEVAAANRKRKPYQIGDVQ